MSLASGTRLGSYEVVAPIGAGGMGEVYSARDSRLDRVVALKIVPEAFAQDPVRLARFEREARTLAALNHPNIAQIYGIEETGGIRALVMELVPGRTLSQMIPPKGLRHDEVLPIARQIVDALEAAHEAGIVHRDLKPANVKVRDDGVVKVLDFGLAKTSDAAAGSSDGSPSQLPTMTSPAMTQQGFIIGTAAYMSPEQAKGRVVDKRSDIWAFGVVLYEMLTGRRLFDAETVSETLAAVLREDIDFARLPADTPPGMQRLLARCLDRDPLTRLRDIGEARILLSSAAAREPAQAVSVSTARWSVWRGLVWFGAGLLVAAAVWGVAHRMTGRPSDTSSEFTLSRLTELPGPEQQPDISSDGRQVLYASAATGNQDIYLLRIGGARAIDLTADSPADDYEARFSPGDDQIVFRSERDGGGLFVMGATGESVRRLTTAGYDPAWSPDGRSIAYATEGVDNPYSRSSVSELWTVDVASGRAARIHTGDAVQPAWSPDGRRIAFWANANGQRDIFIMPASGGTPIAVTHDPATDWSPEWSPDGRSLYFSSDRAGGAMNLWRIDLDPASGAPQGAPRQVTSGVRGIGFARFSADGKRMTVSGYDRTYDLTIAAFDAAHPDRIEPRTTLRNQTLQWCDVSPDGVWLACTSHGVQEDIVLMRSDGTETRRLMSDAFKDRLPTWAPDGKTIAFFSNRSGVWEDWLVQADGSNLRKLTDLRTEAGMVVWSPDGRQAITASFPTPPSVWRFDIRLAPIARDRAELLKAVGNTGLSPGSWSSSGILLAGPIAVVPGKVDGYGVWNLETSSLRRMNLRVRGSESVDANPAFLPDSRHLLIPTLGGLALCDATDGACRMLRPDDRSSRISLSRDGRTLLLERELIDSDVWLMEFKPAGR